MVLEVTVNMEALLNCGADLGKADEIMKDEL
jgi:hypothetical protein